ncbi:MAG: hypothetical protein LUG66_00925 [Clostridiales bacterium]|nr:hypothetical protein [Clostridiales bacterium]
MSDEDFIGFFIAPNMTWMRAYENMVDKRRTDRNEQTKGLIRMIENRLKYEIMLEFGLTSKIGRTLEKSSCSVLGFHSEDIENIGAAVQECVVNELGHFSQKKAEAYERMVLGYLNIMRNNGSFDDPVFYEYTRQNGNNYMLSNDRNRWLPGQQA